MCPLFEHPSASGFESKLITWELSTEGLSQIHIDVVMPFFNVQSYVASQTVLGHEAGAFVAGSSKNLNNESINLPEQLDSPLQTFDRLTLP